MKHLHEEKTSPRKPRTAPIAGERANDPPEHEPDVDTTPETPDTADVKPPERGRS